MHRNPLSRNPHNETPAHAGRGRRRLGVALSAAIITAALAAAPASAATVKLACAGPGGRDQDSAGIVLCAAPAGQSRTITGRVLNDAGKPVPATLTVTRSAWMIDKIGVGYTIKPTSRRTIAARGDGTFSIVSNPARRESIRVEVGRLRKLRIADGAAGQAEVRRHLSLVFEKLGGGAVLLTVRGASPKNLKVQVTRSDGYPIPGQGAKPLDGRGRVTFRLGSRATGSYAISVVRSLLSDLFWTAAAQPKFSLSKGR